MTDLPTTRSTQRGTVLVTGAAGFLGSRVVALLSASGAYDVIASDVDAGQRAHELQAMPAVTFVPLELRDDAAVAEVVAGADYVVHLAALRSKVSQAGGRAPFDVNVAATYTLASAAGANGVKGFVYGSSHLVYGRFADPARWFSEEDATPSPGLSLYAAAKLASESFVAAFSDAFGFDYVALRFGGIYGPQAAPGSNTSVMTEILACIDRGEKPVVSWTRDTKHCLIYVDDAARAVVKALEFRTRGTAVNVVNRPRTAELIYSALVRLYGADPSVLEWAATKSRYQQVTDARLTHKLQSPPATSLEEGLGSIIDWHRATRGH